MDGKLAVAFIVVIHPALYMFHRLELSLGKEKHTTFSVAR